MQEFERHRHLPDADRLSILVGTILLAFALAHFIRLPVRQLSIQLPGIYLLINFGVQELVALLVALLTATGADWLLRDHPYRGKHPLVEHWLLPGLTAWAIGLPLLQLPLTPVWWIGFALGGILLILVLVAEYISIDPEDVRQPPAAAGLTAVSFALFLVLVAGLRFANTRLFLLLPALGLASGLVSLRTVHLRLSRPLGVPGSRSGRFDHHPDGSRPALLAGFARFIRSGAAGSSLHPHQSAGQPGGRQAIAPGCLGAGRGAGADLGSSASDPLAGNHASRADPAHPLSLTSRPAADGARCCAASA